MSVFSGWCPDGIESCSACSGLKYADITLQHPLKVGQDAASIRVSLQPSQRVSRTLQIHLTSPFICKVTELNNNSHFKNKSYFFMKDKTNIAQSVSHYITLHGEVYSGPFGTHSVDDSLGKTKQLLQFLMTFNNKLLN